jgi:hypothetical protein
MNRAKSIFAALSAVAFFAAGCAAQPAKVSEGQPKTVAPKGTTTYDGPDGQKTTLSTDGKGNSKVTGVGKSGETSTFETRSGIDPKELGVELYPGAQQSDGPADSSRIETPKGIQLSAVYTTADKPPLVADFYFARLKSPSNIGGGDTPIVTGRNAAGDEVFVAVRVNGETRRTEMRVIVTKKK